MRSSLSIIAFLMLVQNEGVQDRCFNETSTNFSVSIPGLNDMDHPDQITIPRNLSIVSIAAEPSSQLLGWVMYFLLTEKLMYKGIEHHVLEDRDLFTNLPNPELSISSQLWHYSIVSPWLSYESESRLQARFNLFVPRWLLRGAKADANNYNCSIPLHQHPLHSLFNHSHLHSHLSTLLPLHVASTEAPFQRLATGAVYRSPACLNHVSECFVIAAPSYESYGKCLIQLMNETKSKVVIFFLNHRSLHTFVMQQEAAGHAVMFLGSNLDMLFVSELFEPLGMDMWRCLHGHCLWSSQPVSNAFTPDLKFSAYSIDMTLKKMNLKEAHVHAMLRSLSAKATDQHMREVACDWLINNNDVWKSWVSHAPKKQPVPILLFYPIDYENKNIFVAVMVTRAINKDKTLLPNHQLVLINGQLKGLKTVSRYKYVLNTLSSGEIKAAFGATKESFEELPTFIESFNTIFFSYSSPVNLIEGNLKNNYFSMVPNLEASFEAVGALFKKLNWTRVSLIIEAKSSLYSTVAVHMRSLFKARKIKVVEEVKFKEDRLDRFHKALEAVKETRSNILILLVSQLVLDRLVCALHHQEMTPQNSYVFIYVTGLDSKTLKGLYRNEGNKTKNIKFTAMDAQKQCSGADIRVMVDRLISIDMQNAPTNEDVIILGKSYKEWKNFINYNNEPEKYTNHYHLFDSIHAFSLALDSFLRTRPLQELKLSKLKQHVEDVRFDGLSGFVEFVNMTRVSRAVIRQMVDEEAVEIAYYSQSVDTQEDHIEDKALFNWATNNGETPPDLIPLAKEESCNLQRIRDLFNVSCNSAIAIFSLFIAIPFITLVILVVYCFRKRFYGKAVVDPMISQRLREKWEMNREDIVINRILGHGEFGTVFGGIVVGKTTNGRAMQPVAIKILKPSTRNEDRLSFFVEADLMKDFDHENIMKLVGVCSVDEPPMVVMEFMMYGDLRTYLLSRRHLVDSKDPGVDLGPQTITKMALDVAKGLDYLFKMFCVHRDLACRNCLVHESKVVKISDFGLSHKVFDECYTKYYKDNKIPIRWMSPECLKQGVFSFASDIWSYGVLLYEIFTFGSTPYHDLNNDEVVNHIKKGGTITLPPSCPEDLADLLTRCWAYEAEDRPSIEGILDELSTKPLFLKPCLDLPRPQIDPGEMCSNTNIKNLLISRQWANRLSTGSTTGLLARNRKLFTRAGSTQSTEKSSEGAAATTSSKDPYFRFMANVPFGVAAEAGDEPERKSLLRRLEVTRVFGRSISSEPKTSFFKALKRNKKSTEMALEPIQAPKSHHQ